MESIDRRKIAAFLLLLAAVVIFLYGLGAILTPFVTAALLAYLGDPLVDRLEKLKLGRTTSVIIVFLFLSLVVIALILILGPMLGEQLQQLILRLPEWSDRVVAFSLPKLQEWGVVGHGQINMSAMKNVIADYWQQGGNLALNALAKIGDSGAVLLGVLSNLILIPVLCFYLLRDWDIIVAKLDNLLPRSARPTIEKIVLECDEVLSSFLRGQLVVMISLGIIYSVGLSVVGLDLALLIGTLAGLFSIIPYMGFAVGIIAAVIAAWMQFHAFIPLLYVGIVFAIGQALEGMFLTPTLVGDKIGLHPVAVIFALMAGAHLGGFVGLLLALPIAAMLMVLVRYFTLQYKASALYDENSIDAYADGDEDLTVAELQVAATHANNFAADLEVDSVFDEAIWMKSVDSDES